ncbi:PREDICTED: RING-H2 finger protein ATL66-like [Ipomoea nil]|uniref:RING-H2 finger protein ATL66-like n=1 Tax=Ipomoea nil TaxID=35883 RepID=UPI000900B918|nr:PREDICTED: RING-H2 finger protein ATL66-like [Ipomoea nil]
MEEFEPFHWYINDQGTKRFLVTLLFFGLSLLLIIFLFLRFIRMHASFPSTNDDVISSSIVVTRQNIGRREMMGGNNVSVVAPAPAASSEVIKSLPIFMHNCRLSSENTRLRDGDECCICLGVFEDGEMIKVMPNCLHAFHSHCIDRWLSSSSTCPVCRSSIRSTSAFF